MNEVIINNRNGFIVPYRDSVAIADKIVQIDKINEKDRISILKSARKTIESNHSTRTMINSMLELYNSIYNEED